MRIKDKIIATACVLSVLNAARASAAGVPGPETFAQNATVSKSIPYTLPWDDMPIDLSFIYKEEKPAGCHGFLKKAGDRFVFEDGTEVRFWGTNLNAAQNFPPHEHSRKLARRLAKTGVNLVRLHQMDAPWSTPNLFQYTRGENRSDTRGFDPESLDRLDYLIHCLKEEGIYIYMDLLTYRQFKTGDGVKAAGMLGPAGKPYSIYNPEMIELQQQFNRDLWQHVNSYTGLAYKDDPAIVLAEITNECDLWTQGAVIEPYRSELEKLYRDWASVNGKVIPDGRVDFTRIDRVMNDFFIDVTKRYYRKIIAHLRSLGVKIPIAGTNWTTGSGALYTQMEADFVDSHTYYRGGRSSLGRDADGSFGGKAMAGDANNLLPILALNRVQEMPFFVSEWDNPWPNEWRADSTLLMAAAGGLQGWGGLCIHTYRYTLDEQVDMIGKPVTAGALGGVYYRGGVFDTFNDPAKFGLFYHAALMFRRGDVRPAEKTVSVKLADTYLPVCRSGSAGLADRSLEIFKGGLASGDRTSALRFTAEKHRIEMVFPEMEAGGDIIADISTPVANVSDTEVLSDTGQLYRNLSTGTGWIDSPGTKAVYGFLGRAGSVELKGMKVDVHTGYAVVAVSSLTDRPIAQSDNILLTAVGRADNTGSRYNEDRSRQLDPGCGPIQAEVIEAAVELATDQSNLQVMSVNPQGFITGPIRSEYKAGILKFEIGKEFQSVYYLIQAL